MPVGEGLDPPAQGYPLVGATLAVARTFSIPFYKEDEGFDLHFCSKGAKIKVQLRRAIAGNSPPDWHAICKG